jgi:Ras homolog gene family, member A
VGFKKDLRDDPQTVEQLSRSGQRPMTTADGLEMANRIKAKMYSETSAKTGHGTGEFINTVVDALLKESWGRCERKAGKYEQVEEDSSSSCWIRS